MNGEMMLRLPLLVLLVACARTDDTEETDDTDDTDVADTDTDTDSDTDTDTDADSDTDTDTDADSDTDTDVDTRCADFAAAAPQQARATVRDGYANDRPDVELHDDGVLGVLYSHGTEAGFATWDPRASGPGSLVAADPGFGLVTGGLVAEAGGWSALVYTPEGTARRYARSSAGWSSGVVVTGYAGGATATYDGPGDDTWAAVLTPSGDFTNVSLVASGGATAALGDASSFLDGAGVTIDRAGGAHTLRWTTDGSVWVLRYRAPDGATRDAFRTTTNALERAAFGLDTVAVGADDRVVVLMDPHADGAGRALDALLQQADGSFVATVVDTVSDPGVSACPPEGSEGETCTLDYTRLVPLGARGDDGLAMFAWARVRTTATYTWTCEGWGCDWSEASPAKRSGTAFAGCSDPAWRSFQVSESLPAQGGSLAFRGDALAIAAYTNDGASFDLQVVRVDR